MPDKRYQVFVSSTFADLQEERQQVIQALLELDSIPSGMELFPAADEAQWDLIKRVIDDCDYYLVIVAGRYGSLAADGLSYTEKEYRYALEKGKPIIAFLHDDPGQIIADKTEQNVESRAKLSGFRELCKQKVCKMWKSGAELGREVMRGVLHLIKTRPAVGWVRADSLPEGTANVINRLREENDALKQRLDRIRKEPPPGAANLAQGTLTQPINYSYVDETLHDRVTGRVQMTWDQIFSVIGPCMVREASDYVIRDRLFEEIGKLEKLNLKHRYQAAVDSGDYDQIMMQLRALGLIAPSEEKRSVKDRGITYWSLTPYGDTRLNFLLAITSTV